MRALILVEGDTASADFRRTRAPITQLPVPPESGVYAIYLRKRRLFASFLGGKDSLLYIGQSANLADRELNQHFSTGKTGYSTLRRSLGALLKPQLSLKAIPRAPGPSKTNVLNYRFDTKGEARLTDWMRRHLEVGVHASLNSLKLERFLVSVLRPPLNLTCWPNPHGGKIKALRKVCADEAREARRAGEA